MKTVACVACLDPKRSVHTQTFLRAVELAQAHVVPADIRLTLFDDQASAAGGLQAALQVIAAQPHAAVGHFASASAAAAAAHYAHAKLALFLPAATSSALTRNPSTYRVCANDHDYAVWLSQTIAQRGWQLAQLQHDGSVHGDSVIKALRELGTGAPKAEAATVFAGMYTNALAFTAQRANNPQPLVLTDDAWSDSLPADLLAHGVAVEQANIYVAGIQARPQGPEAAALLQAWQARWPGTPGCYFWETIAAIQLAIAWPQLVVSTVLGPIDFDGQHESQLNHFSLARVTVGGLQILPDLEACV